MHQERAQAESIEALRRTPSFIERLIFLKRAAPSSPRHSGSYIAGDRSASLILALIVGLPPRFARRRIFGRTLSMMEVVADVRNQITECFAHHTRRVRFVSLLEVEKSRSQSSRRNAAEALRTAGSDTSLVTFPHSAAVLGELCHRLVWSSRLLVVSRLISPERN